METAPIPRARCPVCGTAMEGEVWTCERCHTPHHRDCSAYFGGCAIFGCREGAPPARIERDAWPQTMQRVGRALLLRRVESVMLLVTPTFLVLALAATLGTSLPAEVGLALWAGFYGSLVAYLGVWTRSRMLWRVIRAELGQSAGTREFISPTRMQQELRPARIQSQRLRGMRGGLWIALVTSVVMINEGVHAFVWLLILSMLLLKGIEDLEGTWSDIDTCLHRVEGTFAPALKPAARPPKDA